MNDPGLEKVKELLAKDETVVLVPVYKSILDPAILIYCLLVNKVELPLQIGNYEE